MLGTKGVVYRFVARIVFIKINYEIPAVQKFADLCGDLVKGLYNRNLLSR